MQDLPIRMAFEMSLPRAKRVKHVDMEGNETESDGDRWAFIRALETAQQKVRASPVAAGPAVLLNT